MENQFYEFALILAIAAGLGAVGRLLRQPLIVTFIAVGICVGPAWLGIATAGDQIELLAKMGIAILLFLVGLRLDMHVIRSMGPVSLATGLGQVAFTSIVGFVICLGLGLELVPSLYVAVALTFSSTIIIVKLLSDKREIDSLHGRIAVGFLIVQDIVVVLVMIGMSAIGGAQEGEAWRYGAIILGKGALLIVGLGLLMRYVLPPVVAWMANSQELLILFAVAWAISLAALGDWLGFSKEVGAFLAGVSLASTPFRESIGSRLVSLRDFLLLFFFIELGAGLDLSLVSAQIVPASILSLFVLIGNPLIVVIIMGAMGYRKRTGFLSGLAVAQISEFSLILAALGVSLGHIGDETLGLITLVGLITIGLSTYMILYSHPLYERISGMLTPFERKIPHREMQDEAGEAQHAEFIIFGLGRYGHNLARQLRQRGARVLGVDFDPQTIAAWHKHHHAAQYGDADDPELAGSLPLQQARWVVCTVPRRHTNSTLLQSLQQYGYDGNVALTAHHAADAEALKSEGASLVLMPFVDAAKEAVDCLLGDPQSPPVAPAEMEGAVPHNTRTPHEAAGD
jgi:Kef-type K+ transport system membrane component KefB